MKVLIMALGLTLCVWGAEPVAFVKTIHGDAVLKRDDAQIHVNAGDYLFSGDQIQTANETNMGLSFNDGTRIAVGPNSLLKIDDYLFHPSQKEFRFNVSLPKGKIVFESGKIGKLAPEKVNVKVPQGIIGIRGTKFVVEAE